MTQKETIVSMLQDGRAFTQAQIAEGIYGDRHLTPNIYSALQSLVSSGVITRSGANPALYSLSSERIPVRIEPNRSKKKQFRDISQDVISDETLDEASRIVEETDNYGPENELITRCLQKFPLNTDPDIVAMKIGLIDITNSTHLSQHKSLISMDEFCHIIVGIERVDERIAAGDPEVVNEIARSNGKINLFSFASKYCCYHNRNLYGRDDYSILDTILKVYLPRYFPDIKQCQIQQWQDTFQYGLYNTYITRKLDEFGIKTVNRKRKFDHFVWYKNR